MSYSQPTETQTPQQSIDKVPANEQLKLAKSAFGEGTRWEDEK